MDTAGEIFGSVLDRSSVLCSPLLEIPEWNAYASSLLASSPLAFSVGAVSVLLAERMLAIDVEIFLFY